MWTIAPLYYFLSGVSPVIYCILLFLCMYLYGTIFYSVHFTTVLSDYEISLRQQRRAKIQVLVSIVAVAMQLILYVMSFLMKAYNFEVLSSYVVGVTNIMAGCSFPAYYWYLSRKKAQFDTRPRHQQRLLQCLTVTLLVAVCAILRGMLTLSWSSLTPLMSREVYWVWSACSYAVVSQLPLAWLIILFKGRRALFCFHLLTHSRSKWSVWRISPWSERPTLNTGSTPAQNLWRGTTFSCWEAMTMRDLHQTDAWDRIGAKRTLQPGANRRKIANKMGSKNKKISR